MKYNSGTGKYLVSGTVILGLCLGLLLFFNKSDIGNTEQADFYVSKYAPNSLGYFNCKLEGYQSGNKCAVCEDLFKEAYKNREALGLEDDQAVIVYIKDKNTDCVNSTQGGK